MARRGQLLLFGDTKSFPQLSSRRLTRRARRALRAYVAGAATPSFTLRDLAEAQARLVCLREARRRLATRGRGRDSAVRLAEWIVTPAGARIERLLRVAIQRVEELEAILLGPRNDRPQKAMACPTE